MGLGKEDLMINLKKKEYFNGELIFGMEMRKIGKFNVFFGFFGGDNDIFL